MALNKWTRESWVLNLNMDIWNYIGDWAYPTRKNSSYEGVFYHYCGDKPRTEPAAGGHLLQTDKCGWCGTLVPDGIKMVVLLTERL